MSKIAFTFQPKAGSKHPKRNFKDHPLPPMPRMNGDLATIKNCTSRECRWPYGEVSAEMVLCGRLVDREPWCAEHRKSAYQVNKSPVKVP